MIAAAVAMMPDIDPGNLVLACIAVVCAMLVIMTVLIVGLVDQGRAGIDPMAAANGDVPGFDRRQLETFQSRIHAERQANKTRAGR